MLYNPLMHVHSFVAGIALARLLLLQDQTVAKGNKSEERYPVVVANGACVGYCGVLLVMAVDAACLGLLRTE